MEKGLIRAVARPLIIWIALIGTLACQILFRFVGAPRLEQATGEYVILDMSSGFSPEEGYAVLESYGPEGMAAYKITRIVDFIFPLFYGLLFTGAIAFLIIKSFPERVGWARLGCIGIVTALFDYTENIGISLMISNLPQRLYGLARFTSIAGTIKFWLFGLNILALFSILIIRIIIASRKKST